MKKEITYHTFQWKATDFTLGAGKSYFVRTYGCQANVRDGETLSGMLEQMGFTKAATQDEADLLIFNTCAVRKTAEDHVFGEIGSLKHWKEEHPEKIYALCGCMAQEKSTIETIQKTYPQIDIIFGTHNIDSLPRILESFLSNRKRVIDVVDSVGSITEGLPVNRSNSYKAFVNIMYGCDKFCTYCIVPYTRGRERSRKKEAILQEINQFIAQGGKEIVLLGQNVNAYGKDLGQEDGFTELLEDCAKTGVERIRFYTSHPRDYRSSTIDVMKAYPNIMNFLHLPVQSGSDEVLRRMARGYTAEHYLSLMDEMKSKIPNMTFSTDIIVGFPGETEEQFQETLHLVDCCQYDSAFTFVYSPREGTPAAKFEDNVSLQEKKERLYRLNEKVGAYARSKNEAYVGKTLEVLCEGISKKNENTYSGYSEENKLVNFTANHVSEGEIVKVKITDAKSYSLDGEMVEE